MKRRVGTVDICGLPFRVYEADEKGEPLLKGAYAICVPGTQEIVLTKGLSREMRWMHLVHEGLHGIWAHSGLGDIVAGSKRPHLEELMIRGLTPHLVRFFASAQKGVHWGDTCTRERS